MGKSRRYSHSHRDMTSAEIEVLEAKRKRLLSEMDKLWEKGYTLHSPEMLEVSVRLDAVVYRLTVIRSARPDVIAASSAT